MRGTIEMKIFAQIWDEILELYFKEVLCITFEGIDKLSSKGDESINQISGNNSWSPKSPYFGKNQLPHFILEKNKLFIQKQERYNDGTINGKSIFNYIRDIKGGHLLTLDVEERNIYLLTRTLGYENYKSYCINKNIYPQKLGPIKSFSDLKNEYAELSSKYELVNKNLEDSSQETESLKSELSKIKNNKIKFITVFITGLTAITIILFWYFNNQMKGIVLRQIADTNSIKGIVGAWYSYNRTYEARNLNDGLTYNRMTWDIKKDGLIERHWKSMEFKGWTELIENQLNFFLDVYDSDNQEKKIGFRHFNCTKWGDDKTWEKTDTLICVCTSYTFDNSQLDKPLAIREILIRSKIPYPIIKKNVGSFPADSLSWLEKFLPKGQSYLYQNPFSDYNSLTQKRPSSN